MSAYVKIPLQALVLLTGVLVFVFYLFNQPPMLFQPVDVEKIAEERARRRATRRSSREFTQAFEARRAASTTLARGRAERRPRPRERPSARPTTERQAVRAPRGGARARRHRRRRTTRIHRRHADAGRQLRLPDVRHDAAADGAGRADHRGDLRRRDVEHRGGAELARRPRRSSTSTGGCCKPVAADAHYLLRLAARDRLLGPLRLRRRARSPPASAR